MCKKANDDFSFIFNDPDMKHALVENNKHMFDGETPEQLAADDEMVAELEKKATDK